MLSKTDVISLIYAYFYKSGAMLQWNAMMLSMTSFERKNGKHANNTHAIYKYINRTAKPASDHFHCQKPCGPIITCFTNIQRTYGNKNVHSVHKTIIMDMSTKELRMPLMSLTWQRTTVAESCKLKAERVNSEAYNEHIKSSNHMLFICI